MGECLMFDTIKEVQDYATRWLWSYNNEQPNMDIGGITPRQKVKLAAQILLDGPVKNGGVPMQTL